MQARLLPLVTLTWCSISRFTILLAIATNFLFSLPSRLLCINLIELFFGFLYWLLEQSANFFSSVLLPSLLKISLKFWDLIFYRNLRWSSAQWFLQNFVFSSLDNISAAWGFNFGQCAVSMWSHHPYSHSTPHHLERKCNIPCSYFFWHHMTSVCISTCCLSGGQPVICTCPNNWVLFPFSSQYKKLLMLQCFGGFFSGPYLYWSRW